MFGSTKKIDDLGNIITVQHLLLPVIIYLILKIIMVLVVYNTFEWFFSTPTFFYGDQEIYLSCELGTPNVLYSYSLCLLNIDSLRDTQAITLGLLLNTLKDLFYIIIIYYCTNRRVTIIFAIFLSLHPFLALYHPRYVTTVFASLSILLLFAYATKSTWLKTTYFSNRFLVAACTILVGLRYANFVPFLLYFIFKNYRNLYALSFMFICTLILVWFGWPYISLFLDISMNGQAYILSFNNILSLVKVTNIYGIDAFLAACLYLLTHLIALTGFRETAVLYFSDYFFPVGVQSITEFIIFFTFSLFHILGVLSFFKHFQQYKAFVYCVIVNILICILFLTHIRYFIHIMPLALLGIAVLIDKNIKQK